jgi:hypothetical protein
MLFELEVEQDVAGEHRVLTRALNLTPKSKLVIAFQ